MKWWRVFGMGVLWGVGIQALVWPPAYVFQAPKVVYWVMGIGAAVIGGFLWGLMPPLRSNDRMQ